MHQNYKFTRVPVVKHNKLVKLPFKVLLKLLICLRSTKLSEGQVKEQKRKSYLTLSKIITIKRMNLKAEEALLKLIVN